MEQLNLKEFLLGLGFALPFALFNAHIILQALAPREGETVLAAHNRFMARVLVKMFITLAVLLLAGLQGISFLFGSLAGLLLQFTLYLPPIWKKYQRKG